MGVADHQQNPTKPAKSAQQAQPVLNFAANCSLSICFFCATSIIIQSRKALEEILQWLS